MPRFRYDDLVRIVAAALERVGTAPHVARVVANHLVEAEASGVVSHGIVRVPQYVAAVEAKKIRTDAHLAVRQEAAASAVLDGGSGFGQLMALEAMDVAMNKARAGGAAAVTLVNCGHTGRLASYTTHAARHGFIAMMMVNAGGAGQWTAPFGGRAGRLATNPISVAVPRRDGDSMALDIATSAVPEGKIRAMMMAGQSIPEGWVVDHEGRATTNPAALYGPPRGALLPFGQHKGFGLAMIIEAIAGALSGAGCCVQPEDAIEGKSDGVFLCAVHVASFQPLELFQRTVDAMIAYVKSSPTAPGFDQVLTPGEIESRRYQAAQRDGIVVDESTWSIVRRTLVRLRIPVVTEED